MPHLSMDITDSVATLTFANPPLQVMTPQSMNELHRLLPRLAEPDIRAVILTGSDPDYFIRHFSVEELDNITRGEGATWDANMDDTLWQLEHLPKPVIAALNGSAAGGGLETALACDFRIAKEGPFQFGLPEVTVGILPGAGGTQRLPALIGRQRALEMMLRGRLVSPSEALAIGLVEELVPAESSETAADRARTIALEIAAHPPLAVAHIKALVRQSTSPIDRNTLTEESRRFGELMESPEAQALMKNVAEQHSAARSNGTRPNLLGNPID
ncbi:MAG: enoyl-CoA hydratase/isomerase family protein [Pseudomonadota bacterium]